MLYSRSVGCYLVVIVLEVNSRTNILDKLHHSFHVSHLWHVMQDHSYLVSNDAAIIDNAAFLAPLMKTTPEYLAPPLTSILFMVITIRLNRAQRVVLAEGERLERDNSKYRSTMNHNEGFSEIYILKGIDKAFT